MSHSPLQLATLLDAVGVLLAASDTSARIVVVGGAALGLTDLVSRTTADVDVIARVREDLSSVVLIPPDPLPAALVQAAQTVARDFRLPLDWLNTEIAAQWHAGMPPGLEDDLFWRRFGGLEVGFAGRRTLIVLKLFAATDRGPKSVHFQDLVALAPSAEELKEAAVWVKTQDAAEAFGPMVDDVVQATLEAQDRTDVATDEGKHGSS